MYMCFNTCGKILNQTDQWHLGLYEVTRDNRRSNDIWAIELQKYFNITKNLSLSGLINPIYGNNVISMAHTYEMCFNLTGNPVCGNNVTNMYYTYYNCFRLTGSPVCGDNVKDMRFAYNQCYNLYGNMYMYSNNVSNMYGCFIGRSTSDMLNIYVNKNTKSFNSVVINNTKSLVGKTITWTNDINSSNTYDIYYNTEYNIYVYAVDNVRNYVV